MSDEDDFGDFGGFEGADPNENVPQFNNVGASSSPWAVFPPAVPQSQPDLLCAQNTFPTYLDPGGISGGAANGTPSQHTNNDTQNARLSDGVLDGGLGGGVPGLDLAPEHQGSLRTDNPADIFLNTDQIRDNARVLPDLGVGEGAALPDLGVGEVTSYRASSLSRAEPDFEIEPIVNANLQPEVSSNNATSNSVDEGRQPVSAASSSSSPPVAVPSTSHDNSQREEVTSLRTLNTKLEEDLAKCQADLERQNQRLAEIQGRHETELASVRQAGHDTLAVVVEQYKETSKAAVLEQQEISTRLIQEKIKELTNSFQVSFDSLSQQFEEKLKVQGQQEQERITHAVETSRLDQQKQFDEFLEEERRKHREEMEQALQAERERSLVKLEDAIKQVRVTCETKLTEEQTNFSTRLSQQETEHKNHVQATLKEEQEKMEENLKERLREEQERNRVAMETVAEQARQDSQEFINEQRQASSLVRRRHLASLDLFLESARQQIHLLQESEHSSGTSSGSHSNQPEDESQDS